MQAHALFENRARLTHDGLERKTAVDQALGPRSQASGSVSRQDSLGFGGTDDFGRKGATFSAPPNLISGDDL
jgi:hypothetical protein